MRALILFIFLFSLSSYAGINVIPDKDANGTVITKTDAFASKSNYYFRATGDKCQIAAAGENPTVTTCEYAVSRPHIKFNGIEMLGSRLGDTANLKVLDTATGTYTALPPPTGVGVAVPNAMLNQFGFNWNMSEKVNVKTPYVADLYQGMRIVVEITNTGAAYTLYINYFVHEEK